MALPIVNFVVSQAGNGQFAVIAAPGVNALGPSAPGPILLGPNTPPFTIALLYDCTFSLTTSAAVTAGTGTFQELWPDGSWRALATPAPINMTASLLANGSIPGEFLALRLNVTGQVGGVFNLLLKAAVKQS